MNGLRITLAAGVAAALMCMSLSAHADEERGLSAGVRVGYAFPLGSAYSGRNLSDLEGGANPFWFDLGWRFNKNLYVGAFYQFAMTYPPNHSCGVSGGVAQSCDGNDQRFGIDAAFHILPTNLVDPWVGLGIGYEFSRINSEQIVGNETSSTYEGWQIDLQAGADLRFSKRVPFGPYIDFGMGQFNWETQRDQNGKTLTDAVPNAPFSGHPNLETSVHEWLTLGLRVQFNL